MKAHSLSRPILFFTASLISAPVFAADTSMGDGAARYEVTFERGWSVEKFPEDFPLLAHFSPVIGATHAAGKGPFAIGATATDGFEKLCEEGKHQPLDGEIRAAIKAGTVGALIETMDPIRDEHGKAVASFQADVAHPYVSIAAMIAPSPDWCAVAADVMLVEGGRFVDSRSVPLRAWDVGTDSATSYRALDADMQPRGKVAPSDAPYFAGDAAKVGRVTFTRIR